MKHKTQGLARPCNAGDLFLITGGLQCANCMAIELDPEVLQELWRRFGEIPIDDNDRILTPFLGFPVGWNRFAIWHWFEDTFGVSIDELRGKDG
jgi:hypothetical protein